MRNHSLLPSLAAWLCVLAAAPCAAPAQESPGAAEIAALADRVSMPVEE